MPDPREGLSTGASDTEHDVNSNSGFAAALAELAGHELSDEQKDKLEGSDREIAGGLTFADKPETVKPVEDVKPEVVEPVEEAVDPALASVLEKHGGDHSAALAAALKQVEDAQAQIGRQSAEVSETRELRERLAKLEGAAEAQARVPVATPDPVPQSTIETMVEERGGAAVAQWSAQSRPDIFEDVLRAWLASDVTGEAQIVATRYYTNVAVAKANEEAAKHVPEAQAPDDLLVELKQTRQTNEALSVVEANVEAQNPGLWDRVKDNLVPLLEDPGVPNLIKNAVASSDKNTQIEGITALFEIAKGRVVAQRAAQTEETEKTKEKKRLLSLGTGSLKPADERQPGGTAELTSEERQELFRKRVLTTETTSVRDGLTYAKA